MEPQDRTPGYQVRRDGRRAALAAKRADTVKAASDLAATCNTLLGRLALFALFSIVTAFSPDSSLLEPTASVTIPIANVGVPFVAFILIVPFALLGLCWHLAFFMHRLDMTLLDADDQVWAATPFSLPSSRMRGSGAVRAVVYYSIAPITLAAICYKALGLPRYGVPLLCLSIAAAFCISFAQSPPKHRTKIIFRSVLGSICLVCIALVLTFRRDLQRPLDLEGASLQGRHLATVNLADANLARANLAGANLTGATLRRANLAGATLAGSDLTGANLRGAVLTNADLTDARLVGTDLSFANLRGAVLDVADSVVETGPQPRTLFIGAEMDGASLRAVRLERADFLLASLFGADMRLGDFRQADFTGALLQQADLRGAVFWEADLMGADLVGTAIWSADFLYAGLDFARVGNEVRAPLGPSDQQYLRDQLKAYLGRRYWVVRALDAIGAGGSQSWFTRIAISANGGVSCLASTPDECPSILPVGRIAGADSLGLDTAWSAEKFQKVAAEICRYDVSTRTMLFERRMQGVGNAYLLRRAAAATPCLAGITSAATAR